MYQRILVPFDGSDTALQGLDEAVRLARSAGAALHLVHVLNHFRRTTGYASHDTYMKLLAGLRQEGETLLAQGRERAERAGVEAGTKLLSLLGGTVSEMVAQEAEDWGADLIVIGTRGRRGVERILWGSDAQDIMLVAPVPVLLVQAGRRRAAAVAQNLAPGTPSP